MMWSYSEAAIGWLDHFPYVVINHWGLRHAVVLPVALSFWLGGINELTMVLPTKVCILLLILLTYGCLSRLIAPALSISHKHGRSNER